MKRLFVIVAILLSVAHFTPLSGQVLTLLHSFGSPSTDGEQPYAGLEVSSNALFGTTKFGGATGNGTVFTLNADGSGYGILHSFTYNDGGDITAGLVGAGNLLYGAAYQGGSAQGTLFSITTGGQNFATNYSFTGGLDGGAPKAGLVLSGNMLYGVAFSGGSNNVGTVFAVQTNGSGFQVLHSFTGADGDGPWGDLVLGADTLYGTTYQGGSSNFGAIFCVKTNGSGFTVLHNFVGTDGKQPEGGLVLEGGMLYGTASSGGNSTGSGTLFSATTNVGGFSLLHVFTSRTDGAMPLAKLLLTNGILYGSTFGGDDSSAGTIFSFNTNNSTYTVLYRFSGNSDDGGQPAAPLILLGNSLYGTTVGGGATGNGTIFSLQVLGVIFTFQPTPATGVAIGTEDVGFGAGGASLTFPTNNVSYQWLLNGVNIQGATNSSVQFTNIAVTNGGALTVIISDGTSGTNSVTVPFTVNIGTVASNNDNFAQRSSVGRSSSGAVSSSNTNATKEAGEPNILADDPGGKSIWFRWQPVSSGSVTFSTQGSGFDTIMGVFTGTNVANLTPLASAVNDDDAGGYLTSVVNFNYQEGTEYEIVVDGFRGSSGNVVLSWTNQGYSIPVPTILQAPPEQTIVSNGAMVTLVCRANSGVVSWLFNGQLTGVTGTNYVINAAGDSNVGTYIAQVSAGGGVAFTEAAHVQINTLEDGTTDPASVVWSKFLDSSTSPYSNALVEKARKSGGGGDTAGFSVSQTFSTAGAVTEPGQPLIDGQIGGASVWYTYVTPTNGALQIDTGGSSFNTMLGVFIGPGNSFATMTNIGAGYTTNHTQAGQPSVSLANVPKGQTNYIMVDGYKAATGTVHLNIKLGNAVVFATPLQNQYALAGGSAVFSVGATGSIPLGYAWQFNGATIPGAATSILTIPNVQAAQTGAYTVIVTNLVSAVTNSATLLLATVPVITTQPLSHTVAAGSTANLTVTASGAPSPTNFQWNFNGNAIGPNSNTLVVPNFGAANQGTYAVVVSNLVGGVGSSNALLLLNTLQLSSPAFNGSPFGLQLIGAAGGNYILEASTNLQTWTPLLTNTTSNGFISLTDTNAASFSHRFYRAMTN